MRFIIGLLLNLLILLTVALGLFKIIGLNEVSWLSVFSPLIFVFLVKFIISRISKR